MISICIPIYNHDSRALVKALHRQAEMLGPGVEIVCIDDGSEQQYRQINSELSDCCRYVELPQNVGRSRVRNLFLRYVSDECRYLLFADCDLMVKDDRFVKRYADLTEHNPKVVVGGHVYGCSPKGREYRLHYENGVRRVSKSAEERRKSPNRSFMTGNFMIAREVLEQIPFEEKIKGYGHEDTLMGFRLQQHGIDIVHIDNPLMALDLDTNEKFLAKTREGVANLVRISRMEDDPDFDRQVALLSCGIRVRQLHVDGIIKKIFDNNKNKIESLLLSGNSGTRLYMFYKLGLLLDATQQ